MIVVLTGAPGAGKGTQADILVEKGGFRKLSTGDALRKHVKLGTDIGKVAGAIMERGELVPDDVLFKVLRAELGSDKKEVVLLDGYPRNVAQAETLATLGEVHPVKLAVHLDVPKEELVSRLSGRRVCSGCGATYHVDNNPSKRIGLCDKCGAAVVQRADDRAEAVAVRLDVYEKNTRPVLDYYAKKGLYKKVDGTGETDVVFARLKGMIDAL
jgi:adenylate kinase